MLKVNLKKTCCGSHHEATAIEILGGRSYTTAVFSPEFFSFSPVIIIPPLLCTHLSLREVCVVHDQAAHYHTLGLKLGASSLTQHLAGLGVKVVS
jgi:hypothetical protein